MTRSAWKQLIIDVIGLVLIGLRLAASVVVFGHAGHRASDRVFPLGGCV